MSTELTQGEISQELGSEGLIITPSAANAIIDAEAPEIAIIEAIVEQNDSGSTIDKPAVEEAIDTADSSIESESEDEEPTEDEGVSETESDNQETVNEQEPAENHDEKESEESDDEGEDLEDDEETTPDVEELEDKSEERSRKEDFEEMQQPGLDPVDGKVIDPGAALEQLENTVTETKDAAQVINRKDTLEDRYPEWCDIMFNRELPEVEPRVGVAEEYSIEGDITGKSRGTGDFEDFQQLFADRHDRLSKLLSKRTGNVYHVSDIQPRRHGGEGLTVVGLVWDTFTSNNGNYFIELEDPKTNDTLRTVFTNEDMKDVFEQVVPDEAIAIRGQLSDDGGILFGDDEVRRGRPPIMFPDIPRSKSRDGPDKKTEAVLVSDVHMGAEEFYPEYWNKFVDWVRTTPTVEYIFVAGDLVEGIGVYPNQDEELEVVDIHDQYAMTARMLEQLPDDITVFASVGNHDTVRLAEPQPSLGDEFTKYFGDNVKFVGNPVTVNADGVNILMYHGMSIHALAEVIPGLDAEEPIGVMEVMLQKRHVAPVYGKNVRLAGEEEDYLVIETVPDVLHCGHVHKWGTGEYNGVKLINTATWQGQTSFQKSKGIEPDVGCWGVLDLSTKNIEKYTVDDV